VVAAAQHGPAALPASRKDAQYPTSPNEYRPLYRALLTALKEWIRDNRTPPSSKYPLIAEQQLVPLSALKFPRVPGATVPRFPKLAYPADFGPDYRDAGIVAHEPPRLGRAYGLLVPQVDADGMELAGIRMPIITAPLGTATGWNLRSPAAGAPTQIAALLGSWFPLPLDRARRSASKDPRLSIQERYASREDYLQRIRQAAGELIASRLMLDRDIDFVLAHAARLWVATALQR
jgi:hypothetical protein